ncbi:hypothetical protein TRFO_36013 [Tritrichomonas foetus]|uniref:Leucine Rich Repeat family protein n=1 Tax=Tritrichomonas foetus TaxID=1144522 RepID=A0A1J4JJI2_9EUKA|nr:hypothetical protein TRFO_36013 [Tritrichomonas foetus]|eukprot:OHS97725.1 hypothetical protein TRFO_36013 [Tritrichomonas foetus]
MKVVRININRINAAKEYVKSQKQKIFYCDSVKKINDTKNGTKKRILVVTGQYICYFTNVDKPKMDRCQYWTQIKSYSSNPKKCEIDLEFSDGLFRFMSPNWEKIQTLIFDVLNHVLAPDELAPLHLNQYNIPKYSINANGILARYQSMLLQADLKSPKGVETQLLEYIPTYNKELKLVNDSELPNLLILLGDALKPYKSLESLILPKFPDEGLNLYSDLAQVLIQKSPLKHISFANSPDTQFVAFCDALKTSQITGLTFHDINMNQDHLTLLHEALVTIPFRSLSFQNAFKKDLFDFFSSEFLSGYITSHLQMFNLDRTRGIDVGKLIKSLPVINSLSFAECDLDVCETLDTIGNANLQNLRFLNLSGNYARTKFTSSVAAPPELLRLDVNDVCWSQDVFPSFLSFITNRRWKKGICLYAERVIFDFDQDTFEDVEIEIPKPIEKVKGDKEDDDEKKDSKEKKKSKKEEKSSRRKSSRSDKKKKGDKSPRTKSSRDHKHENKQEDDKSKGDKSKDNIENKTELDQGKDNLPEVKIEIDLEQIENGQLEKKQENEAEKKEEKQKYYKTIKRRIRAVGDWPSVDAIFQESTIFPFKELGWSGNPVTDEFLSFLEKNTQLETLFLNDTFVPENPEAIENFSASVLQIENLRNLVIRACEDYSLRDKLYPLLSAVQYHSTLSLLDVTGHQIGDEGIHILTKVVDTCPTLQVLCFDESGFEKLQTIIDLISAAEERRKAISIEYPLKDANRKLKEKTIKKAELEKLKEKLDSLHHYIRGTKLKMTVDDDFKHFGFQSVKSVRSQSTKFGSVRCTKRPPLPPIPDEKTKKKAKESKEDLEEKPKSVFNDPFDYFVSDFTDEFPLYVSDQLMYEFQFNFERLHGFHHHRLELFALPSPRRKRSSSARLSPTSNKSLTVVERDITIEKDSDADKKKIKKGKVKKTDHDVKIIFTNNSDSFPGEEEAHESSSSSSTEIIRVRGYHAESDEEEEVLETKSQTILNEFYSEMNYAPPKYTIAAPRVKPVSNDKYIENINEKFEFTNLINTLVMPQ